MPIDPDQPDVIREALTASDSVDAQAVHVSFEGDTLVLRGSVATFEESAAAGGIAEQYVDDVRNELRVDHNLREGLDDSGGQEARRSAEQLRGSSTDDPAAEPDDLVDNLQDSLTENVPWDPPHEPVEVPTRAESRGTADRGGGGDADTMLDETADPGTAKSLPDLSPEELARAATPDEENV